MRLLLEGSHADLGRLEVGRVDAQGVFHGLQLLLEGGRRAVGAADLVLELSELGGLRRRRVCRRDHGELAVEALRLRLSRGYVVLELSELKHLLGDGLVLEEPVVLVDELGVLGLGLLCGDPELAHDSHGLVEALGALERVVLGHVVACRGRELVLESLDRRAHLGVSLVGVAGRERCLLGVLGKLPHCGVALDLGQGLSHDGQPLGEGARLVLDGHDARLEHAHVRRV